MRTSFTLFFWYQTRCNWSLFFTSRSFCPGQFTKINIFFYLGFCSIFTIFSSSFLFMRFCTQSCSSDISSGRKLKMQINCLTDHVGTQLWFQLFICSQFSTTVPSAILTEANSTKKCWTTSSKHNTEIKKIKNKMTVQTISCLTSWFWVWLYMEFFNLIFLFAIWWEQRCFGKSLILLWKIVTSSTEKTMILMITWQWILQRTHSLKSLKENSSCR